MKEPKELTTNRASAERFAWWWLPDDESRSLPGGLDIEPGECARVRIEGRLSGAANEPGTHDLLWGYLEEPLEKVTLVRVLEMRRHGVNEHIGTISYAKWTLLGSLLRVSGGSPVRGLRMHFAHAEEWHGQHVVPHGAWWNGEDIAFDKLEQVEVAPDWWTTIEEVILG